MLTGAGNCLLTTQLGKNMTELVQTETKKITEIENISKGTKVLSIMGTGFFSAVAGISFFTGSHMEALAVTALTAGNIALTGHWVTHDLTQNLREHGVNGKFKSSVFALWGKKKVYSVTTPGAEGSEIQAEVHVGRGKTQLIEHIPVEPLDLWDSSMSAVRELYKLHRPSYKSSGYDTGVYNYNYDHDYGYSLIPSRSYFYKTPSSYDESMSDYYGHLHDLLKQENKIEEYKKKIDYLESKTNCQVERLEAKKKQMRAA